MDELFQPTVAQFCSSSINCFSLHLIFFFFRLAKLLQVIMEKLDCTLIFVDENIMNVSQLLLKHRLIIIEMNEHYLNYISKKTLAIECLDSIKSILKLQSLGERTFDTNAATEQRVQMCKLLYSKLFKLNTDPSIDR